MGLGRQDHPNGVGRKGRLLHLVSPLRHLSRAYARSQLRLRRICPGRYLALLEIKMAMAMLLGQFNLKSVATSDGKDPAEYLALTMAPVGLCMRVRERM